jgi:hypothetical protein
VVRQGVSIELIENSGMFSGKFKKIRKVPEILFCNLIQEIPEYSVENLNIRRMP